MSGFYFLHHGCLPCHLITFALIFNILGMFRNFRLMIVIGAVLAWIVDLLLYQKVGCGEGTRMIREAGEAEDSPKNST